MRFRPTMLALLALAVAAPLRAQDPFAHVRLRAISTTAQGLVEVDRGKNDGVAVGDVVLFFPRPGGIYRASVVRLAERSALVELRNRANIPPAGTRGEVLIPKTRLAPPPRPPAKKGPPQKGQPQKGQPKGQPQKGQPQKGQPKKGPPPPQHPDWQNKDEGWKPGMRLLAESPAVRPAQRATRMTGRFYSVGDVAYSSEDSLRNTFARVGTDLSIDNPFGRGGGLQMDAEINYKTEAVRQDGADLLVRRLSYAIGGTRFDADRLELGRFLQFGMPEFGVLDGVEWSRRRPTGDRLGVSFGYLPEPDEDFDTLEDLQAAVHYVWTADENEELTIGGGYQKTFHNGHEDRDLLVLKLRHLPPQGWDLHAAAWIDFYHGKDDVKNNGVELTQALASVGRRTLRGDSVDLTLRRVRYPEILRREFLPVAVGDLADNYYDSARLNAWRRWTHATRLHAHLMGFLDEEHGGGAVELGMDVEDWVQDSSHTDLSLFANSGQHSSVFGGRLSYGRVVEGGRWDLFYEVGHHHLTGFANDGDDLIQHRVRASRSFRSDSRWDLSIHADGILYDDELSGILGIDLQRSF